MRLKKPAVSPLRYPGGKACLYDLMVRILRENKCEAMDYAEPFAGGCGLALPLLYGSHVVDIHINDIDAGVWSFWSSVLNETDEFINLVQNANLTIDEWQRQKEINKKADLSDKVRLGFSAFYLNRTNRSGIIKKAGVIGGNSQQGNYKMDCRFNKETLISKIKRVKKYNNRIHLTRLDAVDFLKNSDGGRPDYTFYCIDPPYFNKGACLYTSFYRPEDHKLLTDAVLSLDEPWVVTYDDTEEIKKLYKQRRQFSFDINYSVQTKRVGSELLIASKRLRMPQEIRNKLVNKPRYKKAS